MFGLMNRGSLPKKVEQEFERLFARLKTLWLVEHNEDGTHRASPTGFDFVPIGGMIDWPTNTAPTGWVLCDGAQLSRVDYKALFDVIGTTYGAGNGTTTFNVPDCRGRFRLGKAAAGTGNALAATGGSLDHTHTISGSSGSGGSHTHTVSGSTANESAHTHGLSALTSSVTNPDNPGGGLYATVDPGTTTQVSLDTHVHNTSDSTQTSDAGSAHSHGAGTLAADSGGSHTHGAGTLAADTENPPYIVTNCIMLTGRA